MNRTWPFVVAVGVVGALAGGAIAGRPESVDELIIDPSAVTSTTVAFDLPSGTGLLEPTTTTGGAEADASPSASDATTSTSTTLSASTSTSAAATFDRATVRLVVANASSRTGLAKANGDRMTELGYDQVDLGDADQPVELTTIYYRSGFLEAAALVSADLGIEGAPILEIPSDLATPLTNSDQFGDVIVLLGPDASL
jgi:hypothetical protein